MRNLTVFIRDNKVTVDLDEPILRPETMLLRHATIFWKYKNVVAGSNTITLGLSDIVFEPGYWDFEMIRERLAPENIILSRNVYDRTCSILSKGASLNLKHFGTLLGFEPQKIIAADTLTKSPKQVDVLHGLRYINVKCDCVDLRMSTDADGRRSTILSSIPIVSYETLNSSATNYFDINSSVTICSGTITSLRFTVDSNIHVDVNVDMLLNIVIE